MKSEKDKYIRFTDKSLGSLQFEPQDFSRDVYKGLEDEHFRKLSVYAQYEKANHTLFVAIQKSEGEVFLLPKVVAFISYVREVLPTYNIGSFEFWLNHFSELSNQEQDDIRAKIVGKSISRRAYQSIFPLGMGNQYRGSHFALGHISPDLDTTVASFHCWLAAFGSRLASASHHWGLPSGPPENSVEIDFVFRQALGQDVFKALCRTDNQLSISALDLLTQKNIEKKTFKEFTCDIDHDRTKKAVMLVDEEGFYKGDWRHMDVDAVTSIVSRFGRILIEQQNDFHIGLISLFAKKELKKEHLVNFTKEILAKKLDDADCSREFSSEQRTLLDKFLTDVVGVNEGFQCTYDQLVTKLEETYDFIKLKQELTSLSESPLFDESDKVIDDRGMIFAELEKVIANQKEEFKKLLQHFDTLEIAHNIKRIVLGLEPTFVSHLADLDHIRYVMAEYSHLTVTYQEGDKYYPLGVIHAKDLKQRALAYSSYNDFSNSDETYSSEEIELISYIDHHKSDLQTMTAATGIVMDVQSSNSIYANILIEMNDRYSSGGMTLEEVEEQIQETVKDLSIPSSIRIMQRLMIRKNAILHAKKTKYYVSKDREILEYIQCVYAILDDTDLLTKVTAYDVETMCLLVNRLKSFMLKKEVEIVNFDDISTADSDYVSKAAKKLLQTHDLYSLYIMIYKAKEESIEELIMETARGMETAFFQDTKIISSYACVGQFKHFIKNAHALEKKRSDLMKIWIRRSQMMYKEDPELKLFMIMMSTISSAEELFADRIEDPTYKDEIWIWIPENDKRSETLLKRFLTTFTNSHPLEHEELELEFHAKRRDLEQLCQAAIGRPFDIGRHRQDGQLIVIKLTQKVVVSRKAYIAPHIR